MQTLISGKWLFRHFLVLLTATILVNLGFWQLRRLEEKRTYNASIEATLQQPPILLTGSETDPAMLHFRRVRAVGVFDNAQSMVLRNRTFRDRPGVHLLTPLRLANSNAAVLVNRGWLPREQAAPDRRAAYAREGTVTVEGIAYATQTRPNSLSPLDRIPDGESRLDAWFRVDIDQIQQQLPYPLLPVFIVASPGPDDGPTDTLPQPVGIVELDEGPHLGYAVQWFSFAALLVAIYGVFIRQELRKG